MDIIDISKNLNVPSAIDNELLSNEERIHFHATIEMLMDEGFSQIDAAQGVADSIRRLRSL